MAEALKKTIAIKAIDVFRCIHCGTCSKSCPNDVIRMVKGVPTIAYQEDCSHCFACSIDCPREAVALGWVEIDYSKFY